MMFSASFATAYYERRRTTACIYQTPGGLCRGWGSGHVLVSKINYQHFRLLSVPVLVVAIVLLVLVLTPLGVEINEVRRWLRIFLLFGPTFQPSEMAKVAVIMFFSARLSKRNTEKKKKFIQPHLSGTPGQLGTRIGFMELVPYGAVLGVVVLLVVKEPHMSGTILIMVGAAAVLFAAGINLDWFIAGGGPGGGA